MLIENISTYIRDIRLRIHIKFDYSSFEIDSRDVFHHIIVMASTHNDKLS